MDDPGRQAARSGRLRWRGAAVVNGNPLQAGDALKASAIGEIVVENATDAEVLLFDLP